jgi:hypothetical protein
MLQKLKEDILADGKIDAEEVKQLETTIYADGIVDKEEMDVLFDLNDAVSESGNFDSSFKTLFVKAITDGVLADEKTPGVVDADEAKYLFDKISGDGSLDDNEQALLREIKAKATSIDPALDELYALLPAVEAEETVVEETVTETTVETTEDVADTEEA